MIYEENKRRIITLTSNVWADLKNNNSSYEEDSVPYTMEYNSNTNYKDNSKSNIFKDIISYDTDGVMLWHGKRCESIPASEEEQKEMEELLSKFNFIKNMIE